MNKLKLYPEDPKDPDCEEFYVRGFKDFTVLVDGEDIEVTVNVAPGISEGPQGVGYLIAGISEDIRFLTRFRRFVEKIKDHVTEVDGDFYWRDQDLNVRISLKPDNIQVMKPKSKVPK
jgi:hypothetical protein